MITITFEATYDFVSMADYGKNIHNVIAFESSKDVLGSVENYKGELDDLTTNNNVVTAKAFEGDAEKEAMTDLNPNRNTPSFVYAGTYVNLDVETAAALEYLCRRKFRPIVMVGGLQVCIIENLIRISVLFIRAVFISIVCV